MGASTIFTKNTMGANFDISIGNSYAVSKSYGICNHQNRRHVSGDKNDDRYDFYDVRIVNVHAT